MRPLVSLCFKFFLSVLAAIAVVPVQAPAQDEFSQAFSGGSQNISSSAGSPTTALSSPSSSTVEETWRSENQCPPSQVSQNNKALRCAKGVLSSASRIAGGVYNVLKLPFHVFAFAQECHADLEYKKGLLKVVAPLLAFQEESEVYSTWPKDSEALLEQSPLYQSYLRMPCSQLMNQVYQREKRALQEIHQKKNEQERYQAYISRNPTSERLQRAANRLYPESKRVLRPQEEAFQRMYQARQDLLKQAVEIKKELQPNVLGGVRDRALCLWNNPTVEKVCGLGANVAFVALSFGGGLSVRAAVSATGRSGASLQHYSRAAEMIRRTEAALGRSLRSPRERQAILSLVALKRERAEGGSLPQVTSQGQSRKTLILRAAGFGKSEIEKILKKLGR